MPCRSAGGTQDTFARGQEGSAGAGWEHPHSQRRGLWPSRAQTQVLPECRAATASVAPLGSCLFSPQLWGDRLGLGLPHTSHSSGSTLVAAAPEEKPNPQAGAQPTWRPPASWWEWPFPWLPRAAVGTWGAAPEYPVPAACATCCVCCGPCVQSTRVLMNGSPCETCSQACVSKIKAKLLKATQSPLRTAFRRPRFLNCRLQPRHAGPAESWCTAQGRLCGRAAPSRLPWKCSPDSLVGLQQPVLGEGREPCPEPQPAVGRVLSSRHRGGDWMHLDWVV